MGNEFESCNHKDECTKEIALDLLKRIDEITDDVKLTPEGWKIFYRVCVMMYKYPEPQSQHVSESERLYIKSL